MRRRGERERRDAGVGGLILPWAWAWAWEKVMGAGIPRVVEWGAIVNA